MGPRKSISDRPTRGRGRNTRGSSSSRRNAPQEEVYEGRFISQEREDLYESDFKDRNIAKNKVIDLDFLSRGNLFVGHRLRAMGWGTFIVLSKPYYPELMKEFYANLEYHTNNSTLSSKVGNVIIAFNRATLRGILELPHKDNTIAPPPHSNSWPDFENFVRPRDLLTLVCNKTLDIQDVPVYNQLNVNSRIMHNIITYNVLPHSGSKTYVARYEAFLMFCIHNAISLDFANLMFRHMFGVTEKSNMSLPYPSILTHIFEHFRVPLRNHVALRYGPLDRLDGALLRKMNFIERPRDSSNWAHKSGEPDEHNGEWNSNPAPEPALHSNVRQRTDYEHYAPGYPEGSSSQSWESRIYEQNEAHQAANLANHEAHMAYLATMMGGITDLSNNHQSFRQDVYNRFDYIDERLQIWDERFDEIYPDNNNDEDDDGDE